METESSRSSVSPALEGQCEVGFYYNCAKQVNP